MALGAPSDSQTFHRFELYKQSKNVEQVTWSSVSHPMGLEKEEGRGGLGCLLWKASQYAPGGVQLSLPALHPSFCGADMYEVGARA